MRIGLLTLAGVVLLVLLLLTCMFLSAASEPVVRTLRYSPLGWPAAAPPQRLVLLTDAHVSAPDLPPERLSRIVATVNGLKPDLVLLGGDFVSAAKFAAKQYRTEEALKPLAGLRATSGVVAVMGNHDRWSDLAAVHRALAAADVAVLDNTAVRRGPFVIGGVDDAYTGHADVDSVSAQVAKLGGIPILLSHSPDVFPDTPQSIGLVLAGHTHCGQVVLPFAGPIFTMSRFGRRFACGVIRNGSQTLVVSAGVGTSILPLRLNAPPDIWVIEVGGGS